MNRYIRKLLIVLLLIAFCLHFFSGFFTIINYLFGIAPNKISIDFRTSFISGGGHFFISFLSVVLFWGLYKMKKWFPFLFLGSYICTIVIMWTLEIIPFTNKIYFVEDLSVFFLVFIIPLLLVIYVFVKRKAFA
jgi:hypothetical protein